jgi:hypothetical protein
MREQVARCGQPIPLQESSKAVGWVETPTSMTRWLTDVTQGGVHSLRGLVPSGSIDVEAGHELQTGERLRL